MLARTALNETLAATGVHVCGHSAATAQPCPSVQAPCALAIVPGPFRALGPSSWHSRLPGDLWGVAFGLRGQGRSDPPRALRAQENRVPGFAAPKLALGAIPRVAAVYCR